MSVNSYRYGYQGEYAEDESDESGIKANSFQLRLYDARIGRWMSPDPKGQYHSPYLAMGNIPNMAVDPDGGLASGSGCPECPAGWDASLIDYGEIDFQYGGASNVTYMDMNFLASTSIPAGIVISEALIATINYLPEAIAIATDVGAKTVAMAKGVTFATLVLTPHSQGPVYDQPNLEFNINAIPNVPIILTRNHAGGKTFKEILEELAAQKAAAAQKAISKAKNQQNISRKNGEIKDGGDADHTKNKSKTTVRPHQDARARKDREQGGIQIKEGTTQISNKGLCLLKKI